MHRFHPSLLREYDIRGIVDETLNVSDAYAIGNSFAHIAKKQDVTLIAVGFDGRLSSPSLVKALHEGICDTGVNVIDLSMCPSPLSYFSNYHIEDVGASIIVTGSHNPAEYNGFKFTLNKKAFFGTNIQEIGRIAAKGFDKAEIKGQVTKQDIKQDYVDRLLQDLPEIKQPLKIAWDCGNGAAGTIIHELTSKINATHFFLFDEVDGTFPNHHPDPTVEKNLRDIIKVVKEQKCDLGFAFDGDADRIGVVDHEGKILWADALLSLYAIDILSTHKNATMIGDVKCSNLFFDLVKEHGGKPVIAKTGHSNIKTKMLETNALLAGELSGHIFFADKFYGYDDALYCAVRLLDIILKSGKNLADLTKDFPKKINTPEVRLEVDDTEKFNIIDRLIKQSANNENWEVTTIDGLRCQNETGWWIVRASNTQNVLSIRAEANDEATLDVLKNHINSLLKAQDLPAAF